jgi:ribulose-5-phosphate 4-epimerase/fuculose-1-phosphate aldolase
MILRNHGLLTAGRTVGDAFYEMYYLEQACRLQLAAMQGGQKVVVPPDSVAEHAARQFESFENKGQRPWAALKRRLDRESPDYAT